MTPSKIDAERQLMNEMSRLPRYVRVNADSLELGSNWADVQVAAALLSRTAFMRDTVVQKDRNFPAATLKCVVRKLDVSGKVYVVYMIGGNGKELWDRRWYYCGGALYVHPGDRKIQLKKLMDIYCEAKEAAASLRRQTGTGAQC